MKNHFGLKPLAAILLSMPLLTFATTQHAVPLQGFDPAATGAPVRVATSDHPGSRPTPRVEALDRRARGDAPGSSNAPEPGNLMLLLASLGVMGVVARLRRTRPTDSW